MKSLLIHERLHVRFMALFGIGAGLFLLTWTLSYWVLPEEILRGRTGSALLAGDDAARSFLAEWLRIIALNLIAVSLIVLANRIFRYRGLPLGYIIPLAWFTLYAICLGTNSFSIPMPERMAPSLAVFGRTGPSEMAAFALVASATYSINLYEVTRFIPPASTPILPRPTLTLTTEQWFGLGLGIAILVAANAREAYMILAL